MSDSWWFSHLGCESTLITLLIDIWCLETLILGSVGPQRVVISDYEGLLIGTCVCLFVISSNQGLSRLDFRFAGQWRRATKVRYRLRTTIPHVRSEWLLLGDMISATRELVCGRSLLAAVALLLLMVDHLQPERFAAKLILVFCTHRPWQGLLLSMLIHI